MKLTLTLPCIGTQSYYSEWDEMLVSSIIKAIITLLHYYSLRGGGASSEKGGSTQKWEFSGKKDALPKGKLWAIVYNF